LRRTSFDVAPGVFVKYVGEVCVEYAEDAVGERGPEGCVFC